MASKTYFIIGSVVLLSACGGGGGASNSPVEISAERIFSDGSGVAKGLAVNGDPVLFILDDVGEFVDFGQSNGVDNSSGGLNLSDVRIVESLSTNANLRQGAINSGDLVGNIIIIEDLGGQAYNTVLAFPGDTVMFTTRGSKYGAAPAGSFTYNGTLVTGVRSATPELEYGSFALIANFNNGTFSISGTTESDALNGTGVIDTSTGTLGSNSLTMNTSGTDRSASLYGNLHGNSAESVSGVFHSNEAAPEYAGTFVGSR